MRNPGIGLRSTFRCISDRELLRQIFDRFAPHHARIDWKTKAKEFTDALYEACRRLRTEKPDEHADLSCALHEVCEVAADIKSAERLVNGIAEAGLLDSFKSQVRAGKHELQNAAAWLMLNAPKVWTHLVITAKASNNPVKNWETFGVVCKCRINACAVEEFRKELSDYLVRETLHGEHVHIEIDESENLSRCFVSVNNYPVNSQQFDQKGVYNLSRDSNALNFTLEYGQETGMLRIKCGLDGRKRRAIAELFAQIVLHCELSKDGKMSIDLSRHLYEYVMPEPRDRRIVAVRQKKLAVAFKDIFHRIETMTLTTSGRSNLGERARACLTAIGISAKMATVISTTYAIDVYEDKVIKTVDATLDKDGAHCCAHDPDVRRAVLAYMRKVMSA